MSTSSRILNSDKYFQINPEPGHTAPMKDKPIAKRAGVETQMMTTEQVVELILKLGKGDKYTIENIGAGQCLVTHNQVLTTGIQLIAPAWHSMGTPTELQELDHAKRQKAKAKAVEKKVDEKASRFGLMSVSVMLCQDEPTIVNDMHETLFMYTLYDGTKAFCYSNKSVVKIQYPDGRIERK